LYKLSSGMGAALFFGLCVSVYLMQFADYWLGAFLGAFLALVFIQLLTTSVVLVCKTFAQQTYNRVKKVIIVFVIGTLAVVAIQWYPMFLEKGMSETVILMRHSEIGYWVFLPLEPFARTIIAESVFPGLICWGALAAAIDLALLAFALQIDVNYLESSVVASQKRYALLQRRRRGGSMIVKPRASWRLPPLPWLGGAGPIAWRQLLTALRGLHGLLSYFLIIFLIAVAPMFFQAHKSSEGMGILIGQMCFISMITSRIMSFDFRGDIDLMDWAKSLPIRSMAIVLGQLITPVLLMTFVHFVILSIAAFKSGY